MRRYRIIPGSFDARASLLLNAETLGLDANARRQEEANLRESVRHEYGDRDLERKLADFIAIGVEPLSLIFYHNMLFRQARQAFVAGCYFPALTGACTLGERILNHLVLDLRDDFKATTEYKRVSRQESFNNWDTMIDVLAAWDVLLPSVVTSFRKLKDQRNRSIHFRPETAHLARSLALDSLGVLANIIDSQFGAFYPKPWYIDDTPGETFVREESEADPFVRKVLLPYALHVGPGHTLRIDLTPMGMDWQVEQVGDAGPPNGSDEDFVALRLQLRDARVQPERPQ